MLVGLLLAPKLNAYSEAQTVGDVIGEHYGRLAQILTGFVSFLYCAGIVGVVAKAGGAIVGRMTGQPEWVGVVVITLIVLLYTVRGGIRSVISTDIFQFTIICLGVILVLLGTLSLSGSENIFNLSPIQSEPLGTWTILGLFIGFLLGETLVPPYAARCLITKQGIQAKSAFIYSGIFSVIWFIVVIAIGVIGSHVMPETPAADIFIALTFSSLGVGLLGLVVAAIISIIMSTQDSFLNAAAVSFTRDLLLPISNNNAYDETKQVVWSKTVTLIIGILGVIFALSIPGLIEGILAVYTLWAPTVIIPLIAALLLNIRHPKAGMYAIVAGALVAGVWEWILGVPNGIPSLVPGILANLIVFSVTYKVVRT